jgi:AraC-like DNA-binding protein
MLYDVRIPRPPLSFFIENLWFHQGFVSHHKMERLLPDGGIELIIDLTDTPKHVYSPADLRETHTYRNAWISGQQSRNIVIEAAQNSHMYGVRFRPGGLYPFLKSPVSELNDVVVDPDALWGRFMSEVRERLLEAETPADRFTILEEMMRRRVARSLAPDPGMQFALSQISKHSERVMMRHVAAAMGLSQRQLVRRFDERVGLKPKTLARVFRFNTVLRRLQTDSEESMAAVAQDCGYFDQAHFIHEFQELSRMTPSQYLARRIDFTNFVPIS